MRGARGARGAVVALAVATSGLAAVASCSEPYGAGVTTTLPDGSLEGSAAPDVVAADAGKEAGFCETQGTVPFCADFDDKQALTSLFSSTAGRVFVDENVATSLPSSLRVIGAGGVVDKTFTQALHLPYALSASVRVAPFEAGAPPTLLPIRILDDGAAECSFNIELLPDSGQVVVAATVGGDAGRYVRTFPFGRQIIPGTWARVRLEIANGTSVVKVALTIDGLPAVPFTDTHCPAVTGKPTLSLGVLFGDGAEVSFDDVVFDAN